MLIPLLVTTGLAGAGLAQEVEPQPLPEGVADTGINVLYDSSHQFAFFNHWGCQDAIRSGGHRVTGNQASLHRALKPGTPLRVREQKDHTWNTFRPFVMLPAPEFDVVWTYQHADYQPYLDEEKAALRAFVEAGGGLAIEASRAETPLGRLAAEYGAELLPDPAQAFAIGAEAVEGIEEEALAKPLRVARFSEDWTN